MNWLRKKKHRFLIFFFNYSRILFSWKTWKYGFNNNWAEMTSFCLKDLGLEAQRLFKYRRNRYLILLTHIQSCHGQQTAATLDFSWWVNHIQTSDLCPPHYYLTRSPRFLDLPATLKFINGRDGGRSKNLGCQ